MYLEVGLYPGDLVRVSRSKIVSWRYINVSRSRIVSWRSSSYIQEKDCILVI